MDLLAAGRSILGFDEKTIQLLADLLSETGGRQAALEQLRQYALNPVPDSTVGRLATRLGIDPAKLQALHDSHGKVIALLFGRLRELTEPLSWPLERAAALPAAAWSVNVTGQAAATLAVDTDGTLIEGAIDFDPANDAYLEVAAHGTVGAGAEAEAVVRSIGVQAAFRADADVVVSNYFRHRPDDLAIAALAHDVRVFRLPGTVRGPHDLGTVTTTALGKPVYDQVLRVKASGGIRIGGALAWSTSYLGSYTLSRDQLELNQAVTVGAALAAGAEFSYKLEGLFDIIVHASPDTPSMVRIRLAKSQLSGHDTHVALSGTVGIAGLDGVAKALLDTFVPQLDALVGHLEQNKDKFADLESLFRETAQDKLESLLAQPGVAQQIDAWLRVITGDPDLKAKLIDLLTASAVKISKRALKDLEGHLDEARKAVTELIGKYRATREKLDGIVQASAKLKISAAIQRRRRTFRTSAVMLDIDLDPSASAALYRAALAGDFQPVLLAAQRSPAEVVLRRGEMFEGGTAEIGIDLSFDAFGFGASTGTILRQEWDHHISSSGEITIGVTSELENYVKSRRGSHALLMLANTQVLGVIAERGTVHASRVESRARIEYNGTEKLKNEALADLQGRLTQLAVRFGNETMGQDLGGAVLPPGSQLAYSVVLALDDTEMGELAGAGDAQAQRSFADAVLETFKKDVPAFTRDASGRPAFIWPVVVEKALRMDLPLDRDAEFSSGETRVIIHRGLEKAQLFAFARYAIAFARMLAVIRDLRDLSAGGGTAEQIRSRITDAHGRLMKNLKIAVASDIFAKEQLGRVVFKAIVGLVSIQTPVLPVATVQVGDLHFTYGDDA